MEHAMDQKRSRRMEELEVDDVVKVLQEWEMEEFVDFVTEKRMDGRKLLEITEGIVKLWRPKANAKQFIHFIHNLKQNPDKYIKLKDIEPKDKAIEAQYQTVNVKRMREQNVTTANGVEEILKKLVPAKSFLYRNQVPKTEKPLSSYVPMEGSTRKTRRFFRLSYDYPNFDLKQFKFSRNENFNDRGYYSIKSESSSQKIKKPESRTKYKSLSAAEEIIEKFPEDHFYEDLCYNDMDENKNTDLKIANPNVKPCMAKIQELFQSFKLPFFRRSEEIEGDKTLNVNTAAASEKETHIYENSDSIADMYDSVHVNRPVINVSEIHQALPVEEYLEPVQVNRDYCDVETRARDESILGYIMNIFETRFGIRRETNDSNQTEECDDYKDVSTPDERDTAKWPDDRKVRKTNMADRPLPVPVENEPYYMNIDRDEAENLLRGHPDGTFVLRPSSQPNHAYTLTVSCSNAVHNVGVRRRPDGRLALGFARRGERSFASVTSLLRHHRRRRLLLVAGGSVCGATTLNESPQYYQTPSGLPVLG